MEVVEVSHKKNHQLDLTNQKNRFENIEVFFIFNAYNNLIIYFLSHNKNTYAVHKEIRSTITSQSLCTPDGLLSSEKSNRFNDNLPFFVLQRKSIT